MHHAGTLHNLIYMLKDSRQTLAEDLAWQIFMQVTTPGPRPLGKWLFDLAVACASQVFFYVVADMLGAEEAACVFGDTPRPQDAECAATCAYAASYSRVLAIPKSL